VLPYGGSTPARPRMSSSPVIHITNTHPLKVRDIAGEDGPFRVSAYTIRQWAKAGKLSGAEKRGRDWCFPADVRYVAPQAAPLPSSHEDAVREALQCLNHYQVGAPRAA
jgi:hypothetical protein